MVTSIQLDEDSPIIETIRSNTARIDPTYAAFLKTGLPASEFLRFADRLSMPADNLGIEGRTWLIKSYSNVFALYRDRAPEGEYREEFLPSGGAKYYKTHAAAAKARDRLNKKVV